MNRRNGLALVGGAAAVVLLASPHFDSGETSFPKKSNQLETLAPLYPPGQESTSCVNVRDLPLDIKVGQVLYAILTPEELQRKAELLSAKQIGNFAVSGSLTEVNRLAGKRPSDAQAVGKHIKSIKADIEKATGGLPVGVAGDFEGGRVQRDRGLEGAVIMPSAHEQANDMSTKKIATMFRKKGEFLKALGFTTVFGPVVDVGNGSQLGDRSYGADKHTVISRAGAAAKGLHDAGLAITPKHYPGLGKVNTDTHKEQGKTPSWEVMKRTELLSFKHFAALKPPYMMMGHGITEGLTNGLPASISPEAYKSLREFFQGAIMVDEITMEGVKLNKLTTPAQTSIRALEAGADIVLVKGLSNVIAVRNAVEARIRNKKSKLSRDINDKVQQALKAKGAKVC